MKRINLLPKSEQQEVRLQFFTKQLVVFWLWVLISLLLFLIITLVVQSYLKGQVTSIDTQINADRQVLKSSDNEILKQQVGDLNNQISNLKNLSAQHYYWSKALAELGNLLAADMQVDLLSLDRASGKVEIRGTAGTRDSVLKFWSDIHKSAYFKNINFPLSNLEKPVSDSFTFTFYVNPESLKQ